MRPFPYLGVAETKKLDLHAFFGGDAVDVRTNRGVQEGPPALGALRALRHAPRDAQGLRRRTPRLKQTLGTPRKATDTVLIYDNVLPNVMVVAADDPKSVQGKKGLGVLAVRYYDPR